MDLYDLHQNHRIGKFEQESKETAREVQENHESVLELKAAIQKLSIACHAMWQLLEESTTLSKQDLITKIQTIEDHAKAAEKCPSCSRPKVSKKSPNCLYCGTVFPKDISSTHVFQI